MSTTTQFWAYGFEGLDLETNEHIKTHLVFGIADFKKKSIAWYLYSQGLRLQQYKNDFDAAGTTIPNNYDPRKDKRITLFATSKTPRPLLFTTTEVSSILGFGSKKFNAAEGGIGTLATLKMYEGSYEKTACFLWIDTGKNGTSIDFELDTVASRRGTEDRKDGRVHFLATEPFNQAKLSGAKGGSPKVTSIGPEPARSWFL